MRSITVGLVVGALVWSAQEVGECTSWCAPPGHEDEVQPPEGIPVVACVGTGTESCVVGGSRCADEHRAGCSHHCRNDCCSCCSI